MDDAAFLIATFTRSHWANHSFFTNTAPEAWYLREGLDQRIPSSNSHLGRLAYSKPHGLLAQPPKAVKRFIFNSTFRPFHKDGRP